MSNIHNLPPGPPKRPHSLIAHSDERIDPWYWLNAKDDPEVIRHLEAENEYTASQTAHTGELQGKLFTEIKSRILETDLSFPVLDSKWYYYSRTLEGSQYPIHARRPALIDSSGRPVRPAPENIPVDSHIPLDPPKDEVILLDENELAGDSPYFALGNFTVSPDHRLLAYSTDFDGSELYDLWVRDIESGEIVDGPVPGTYYGFAWSKDAGSFFYTRPDEAMRPFQVWLHRVGSPNDSDRLVYEEKDPKFYLSVGMTKDEELIVIESDSRTTSETRVISSFAPEEEPKVVLARRSGIEHSVEHVAGRLLILTNDCAEDFRLVLAPIDDPAPDNWEDVVPHRPGTRLDGFDIFENHIALFERSEACATTKIMPRRIESDPATRPAWDFAATVTVPQPEEVSTTWDSANPEIATSVLRYGYTSMVTPSCIFDYDMETGERTLLKSQPVLGGYEPKNYVTERLWAVSADGARIPISLVRRSDLAQQSPHPTLLYGYGSYEASMDPTFSSVRLSLLDRGFVYAIAHVRGGGEMGRKWYEQGKMLAKRNSFEDFVACARHLIDTGISTPSTLVARGGSAGGLLMGAVANLAPELFAAIVAEVPFVDCLTTILDETLPLTVNEWEEWGNPVEDRDTYMYMKSYSPYDNVRDGVQYPAILATAGLNDPRVSYWEPAKWVARLREANPSNRIMLKTEMGAGHQGPSGRYDAWKDEAFVLAFILDAVGLSGT